MVEAVRHSSQPTFFLQNGWLYSGWRFIRDLSSERQQNLTPIRRPSFWVCLFEQRSKFLNRNFSFKHLLSGWKTLNFAMSYTLLQRQPLADAPEKQKLREVRSFGVSVLFPLKPLRRRMFLTASSRLGWLPVRTQQFKNTCEQCLVGRVFLFFC